MPLVKPTYQAQLKASIASSLKQIMNSMQEGDDPNTVIDKVADELATAISDATDTYIKSATVTTPAGVAVATAGSPTAQTGATVAPGIGTIS